MTNLNQLGWNESLDEHFKPLQAPGFTVGRVAIENHDNYLTQEIGCAVIKAVENGTLSNDRHESYLKLYRELAYLKNKQEQINRYNSKSKFKSISCAIKTFKKLDHKSKFR